MSAIETATLTADEVQLLESYRALSTDAKELALTFVRDLESGERPKYLLVKNNQHGTGNVFLCGNNNICAGTTTQFRRR